MSSVLAQLFTALASRPSRRCPCRQHQQPQPARRGDGTLSRAASRLVLARFEAAEEWFPLPASITLDDWERLKHSIARED